MNSGFQKNAFALCLVSFLAGCTSSSSSSAPPADAGPDVSNSSCGKPGDVGNSLGIGKFCLSTDDCKSNKLDLLCSSVANGTELTTTYSYFCTAQCNPTKEGFCGEGAVCACTSVGCGCSPLPCAIDAGLNLDAGGGGVDASDGGTATDAGRD
jgi:hypothetical protein